MDPITIRPCTVDELASAPGFSEALAEYADECAIPELGRHDAQLETYRALEVSGHLRLIGAFDGDDLAGFILLIVSIVPHYGVKTAASESIFVRPRYRHTGAGLSLIGAAEVMAKVEGAAGLFITAPVDSRLVKVMPGVGYRETNRVFFRGFK